MFSPLAKLFGIKVILTFHSANYEHKKWGKFAKLLLKGSEKIALSQADKVIFVNKFQLQKSPKNTILNIFISLMEFPRSLFQRMLISSNL